MRKSCWILALFCSVTLSTALKAAAPTGQAASSVNAQTPAEQEIVRQLSAGREADLTNLPEGQRSVRAAFFKQVLAASSSQVQGGSILITGAEIPDAVMAGGAGESIDVPLRIRLARCHFASAVDCDGCHFHGSVTLVRCRFDGGLHLPNSQVDGDLQLVDTTIALPKGGGARAFLITGTHITGLLSLERLRLNGETLGAASLVTTRVDINLTNSGKIKLLNLANLNADHVSIANYGSGTAHINTLQMNGADIKNNLILDGLSIGYLTAQQVTAARANLINTTVERKLNLSRAAFGSFLWHVPAKNGEPSWPKDMVLDDFTFKSGIVTKVEPSAAGQGKTAVPANAEADQENDVTLDFLKQAEYSQSAFTSYEQELEGSGRSHDAEDVYLEMHRARRRHDFKVANPATWLTTLFDYFQEYFLGYGRSVVPPLVWSIVFIALGTYLFRRRGHIAATDEKAPPFSPFWYSLEMFLPIVDLGMGKSWRPREDSFLVTYARIHQIAGWVLIPVALAAITGAVK